MLRPPSTRATAAFAGVVGLLTIATATGLVPRWPGALHLVALPPLDLAADLRWLLARAPSWPVGLAVLALLAGVRITVLASLAATSDGPRWRLAATTYAVATPLVLLAAQLDFVAHAALYSRLFGVALGLLATAFLLFAAAPFAAGEQHRWWPAWRRSAGAGFRVADLAAYAAVLVGLGALAEVVPDLAIAALVPVSGAATWLVVARLRAPAPSHARLHLAGAAALGLAVFALVVVTRGQPWHVAPTSIPGPPSSCPGSTRRPVRGRSSSWSPSESDSPANGSTTSRTRDRGTASHAGVRHVRSARARPTSRRTPSGRSRNR
jgi:hypothetical protein